MRKLMSLFILIIALNTVQAQTIISGSVKDAKSRPVIGASITLKDTYDGATSDSSGRFSFKTTEKGHQTLVISAIGYKEWEQALELAGQARSFQVVLKEDISELKAVVITAGSFEAGDRKKGTVL